MRWVEWREDELLCRADMRQVAEGDQGTSRSPTIDYRGGLGSRWVPEERPWELRHWEWEFVGVLIPNRPVGRLDEILSTRWSRPPMEGANHLDSLSEALPEIGISSDRHSWWWLSDRRRPVEGV